MSPKWLLLYTDEDGALCLSEKWFAIYLCLTLVLAIAFAMAKGVGTTQMSGYVVMQEQTQYPWKTTKITYTLIHPTSIVEVTYYYQTYDGWYDFELGRQYKITAYRDVIQFYPIIVEMNIID